jgi:hypothetical protein
LPYVFSQERSSMVAVHKAANGREHAAFIGKSLTGF